MPVYLQYATPTHNWSIPSCYSSTYNINAFNDCYIELTPYTVLANCYGVSTYDTYQFQGPRPLTIMTTVAIIIKGVDV